MSETSICNGALVKLGAETIENRTDGNNRARACNARFDQIRDAELRRHRWRFAIERVSIAALAATPDSDFAYQYQLPNDYLRLIEGGDITSFANLSDYRGTRETALYSIEGRKILTDLGAPLAIRYIKRVEDTSQFDSAFAEALSARLAYEICKKVTGNDSERDRCLIDYKSSIREAIQANALEVAPQDPADDTWMIARAQ